MLGIFTKRWAHFLLLFVLLFSLFRVVSPNDKVREKLQFIVFDRYTGDHPRPPTDKVKIVDIDDLSLSKVGQWPWPRTKLAQIVENLTAMGAKVIAFDGVLAEPDRTSPTNIFPALPVEAQEELARNFPDLPDYDHILAESIKESGRFVTAFSHGSNEKKPRVAERILIKKEVKDHFVQNAPRFKGTALFLPELEANAAGNGSFMAKPEIDGLIRKTAMIFSDGETIYPSLSAEALRVSFKPTNVYVKIGESRNLDEAKIDTGYRMFIDQLEVPIDDSGVLWVYFRKFDREKDYISAYKILDPAYHQEVEDAVKGRILFVGSTAEGLKDLRATPHDAFLPGVEIHANIAEQILQGKYLIRPDFVKDIENNFVLVVGLIIILLAPFIGAIWMFLLCALTVGVAFLGSWTAFINEGILLDPVYPSLAVGIIFISSTLLTYIRTEAERKQVKEAFGLYISPDFMKELTKDPDKLRLGGETRELTVMFTDIRSFTSISEMMSPEELIQLMNDFLTPMSDLVMSHRGTIDKYMGDAMMAFWNAPLDDPDHARNACMAALHMNTSLKPINDALKLKAEAERREPLLLKAGIGINTGPASVGNMGSRQRFAYSALGDTVNLASRIEGQTKYYGISIMVGPDTQKAVPDFATLEADLIRVKGKKEPVRLYGLIGDPEYTKRDFWEPWRKAHEGMIAAYRLKDFTAAEKLLKECLKHSGERLHHFYALYQERIDTLKAEPPTADWDGVYVATSK